MESRSVGYARMPEGSDAEEVELERRALEAAGCNQKLIFIEVLSASEQPRPQLEQAMGTLKRGDTLVVTNLRRFALDIKDLAIRMAELQGRGVSFRALSWQIDTATDEGRVFVKYLAPLVAFESDLRRERQRPGIARAKAAGKFTGREPTARQKTIEVLNLRAQGWTIARIAAALSIGEASVFRIIKAARTASPTSEK